MTEHNVQRVAIVGFGAIGKVVAEHLDRGIDGLSLAAVSARDTKRAEAAMAGFAHAAPVLPLARLGEFADIVVECAPAALLREIAEPALAAGCTVIVLSCGALVDNFDLVDLARRQGGRILVPTGALLALDAVQAAAVGDISRVHMVTRKPPNGLAGAPYLVQNGISVDGLNEAKRVFNGTAREAARAVDRNIHRIEVEADAARLMFQIENVPSAENPRTGRLTPLSVVALLKKLSSPLAIGT